MPYATLTLSTANTTSPTATPTTEIDWIGGKPISVLLSFGGSSTVTNDCTIQYTLDDLQRIGGSSRATWVPVSGGIPGITQNATSVLHFASTTWWDTGYFLTFHSPVAAVRLSATSIGSTGGLGTINLRVLQGEGG